MRQFQQLFQLAFLALGVVPVAHAQNEQLDARAPVTTFKTTTASPAKCTTTYVEPFPCGDCGQGTVSITRTIDCQGCSKLTTVTSKGVGICACPTAPATRTIGVCRR